MIHEKMDADLTEAITTQAPLKPGEELKKLRHAASPKAPDISREETGEVNIEDLMVTQKFEMKTDAPAPAKPGPRTSISSAARTSSTSLIRFSVLKINEASI